MSQDQQDQDGKEKMAGIPRRQFLKLGGLAGLTAGVGGVAAPANSKTPIAIAQPPEGSASQYPIVDVAALADLEVGSEISFDYPDEDSPALLMRLSGTAEGGIGPGASVVAFSQLCTHKGCPLVFKKGRGMLLCPCHWSSFDPAKGGRLIIGQASERLPQIALRLNNDRVEAVGISGLIYGRHTNIK